MTTTNPWHGLPPFEKSKNPWLGLASYEEPKNDGTDYLFCGRDEETLEMVRLIDNNLFVTLYGSSGIGKTSLLRAGVIPILRRKDYFPLYVRLSQEPKELSYSEAIVQKLQNCGLTVEKNIAAKHPDGYDRFFLWEFFATTRFLEEGREVYPVIILDQFEEVFREGDKAKAELLLKQIYLLLNDELEMPDEAGWSADTNYRFVASIREDFLFVLEDSIDENSLDLYKSNRYRLRPMKPEQARQVVQVPGKDNIEETEKDAVTERIIALSKRQRGNDIDTLMLSLVCAGTYEKKNGEKITLSDLAVWKDNPMEVYYKDAVKRLTANQIRYIQQHLIREDGSRRRVDADKMKTVLGEATYLLLTTGKNRLFAIGDKEQIELMHDQLGMAVYEERRAFEEQERKKKQKQRLLTIIGLSLVFAILGLGVGGYSLKQKRRAEKALSAEETARQMAEEAKKENENSIKKLENATKEKENTIKELEEKNIALAHLNAQLEQERQRVSDARWDSLKNKAQANAGNALSLVNTDALAASLIALEEIPSNISNPDRPLTAEAEALLRNAITSLNRIFEGVKKASFYGDSKKIVINDGIIINTDNGLPVLSELSDNINIDTSEKYRVTRKGKIIIIRNDNHNLPSDTLVVGENLSCFKLSPDGKRLFTSYKDSTNIIWDVNNKVPVITLKGLLDCVKIAEFNPAKKQLFTATQNMANLWDSETGIPTDTLKGINEIVSASYSPEGDFIVAASYWNSAPSIIWRTVDGKEVDRYKINGFYIKTVEFSPDGQCVLLTTQGNAARIWDVSHIYQTKGDIELNGCKALAADNNNNLLYRNNNQIYYYEYDKMTHHLIAQCCNKRTFYYCCFFQDGERALLAGDEMVIWDIKKDKEIFNFEHPNKKIYYASLSPNNKYVITTSYYDTSPIVWSVETGKKLFSLKHTGCVNHASFSSDCKYIVTACNDNCAIIWDAENGDTIRSLRNGHSEQVRWASYCPNNKYVVTVSWDKTAIIWDTETGKPIRTLQHTNNVNTASFSNNGKYILTASGLAEKGNTIVWDFETGKQIKTYMSNYSKNALWGANDNSIITWDDYYGVKIWDFPPLQLLIDETRERFKNRHLTPEERRKYYLE